MSFGLKRPSTNKQFGTKRSHIKWKSAAGRKKNPIVLALQRAKKERKKGSGSD